MLIGAFNSEFLNHNSLRSYPLSEKATKTPADGSDFRIPNDFFVGAKIVTTASPAEVKVDEFYISKITVYSQGANVTISYAGNEVATCSLANNEEIYPTFALTGVGEFASQYHITGHITLGSFETLKNWPGSYSFDLSGGRLDPDVINYSVALITPLVISVGESGSEVPITSMSVIDHVRFTAGKGIKVTEQVDSSGRAVFKISKEMGAGDGTTYIRTINAIAPDESGNFQIESLTGCLSVDAVDNGITLSETCTDPCCGCEELETIDQQIVELQQANVDIQMYQQKLEEKLLQLATALNITGI